MSDSSATVRRAPGRIVFHLVTLFALTVLIIVGIMAERSIRQRQGARMLRQALPVLGRLPAFELIESSGRPFGRADLKGKVWVVDFIFTRCSGPCPVMSRRMAAIQDSMSRESDARLVSFSVDPEFDTPQVLAKYAGQFGANPERWIFLTGKYEVIRNLAVESFKVTVDRDAPPAGGRSGNEILHSTYLILVDRSGRIRGYYDSASSEALRRLHHDMSTLLKENEG
ncbi:MAG: SCO family protein [Verrucomicrobia bacterium]|nr:SCO family protein [Verrucomicrobiota bacterium]